MFSLQRAVAVADGLVQVTPGAKLEDQVDMRIGLERVDQVDDVSVRAETAMQGKLLRLVINGEVETRIVGGRFLGQALDGHGLVGLEISGHEDHAEGAMVER